MNDFGVQQLALLPVMPRPIPINLNTLSLAHQMQLIQQSNMRPIGYLLPQSFAASQAFPLAPLPHLTAAPGASLQTTAAVGSKFVIDELPQPPGYENPLIHLAAHSAAPTGAIPRVMPPMMDMLHNVVGTGDHNINRDPRVNRHSPGAETQRRVSSVVEEAEAELGVLDDDVQIDAREHNEPLANARAQISHLRSQNNDIDGDEVEVVDILKALRNQ